MDPFQRLPAEIIQAILLHTADFVGVESLLVASPRVRSVFWAESRLITKNLIASNPITRITELSQLCQRVAAIQSAGIECANLEDYRQTCDNSHVLLDPLSEQDLYNFISTAARIQRLACICLHTMQRNLVAAVEKALGPVQAEKSGQPLIWIEEYRVYWALWHLQHYSALRQAARNKWNWSADSLKDLDQYNVWNGLALLTPEQIWTVAAVLCDMGLRPVYPHTKADEPEPKEPEFASWSYAKETPIPLFQSLELPPNAHDHPLWSPPSPPDTSAPPSESFGRSPSYAATASPSTPMFRAYGAQISRHRNPSRGMIRMRPFRRLGVVVWDAFRLCAVGLFHGRSLPRDCGLAGENDVSWFEMAARWLALVGEPVPEF
ncbi:hypothetical protein BDV12DRAFT_167588 [Aspergillus spectabilis]